MPEYDPESGAEISADDDTDTASVAVPELVYGSTQQWLTEWMTPTFRRYVSPTGQAGTWCPSWWSHAEAITRLEALWRAWEFLRLDGKTGMSVWWKDHADYHMAVLLDADGPFKGCSTEKGHADNAHLRLPLLPAPEGWFPDERETVPAS